MDYIERKALLKQAREALEAGGVDIDRLLVAMEQEIENRVEYAVQKFAVHRNGAKSDSILNVAIDILKDGLSGQG